MKKLFVLLLLCLFTTDSHSSGIASNSASAPCTNNTLETYSGNSNLAADWQPNTIQLRWYNENEKMTVQQSAQSCTYDGTLTVPQTPPTRVGYTFAGWEVKYTIPAGYTELEYIESASYNYIDTGFKFTGNTVKYELVYSMSQTNHNQTLFGASDNNTNWSGLEYYYDYGGSGGNSRNLSALYVGTSQIRAMTENPLGVIHKYSLFVDRNNNIYELSKDDRFFRDSFSGTVTSTVNITLFAHNLGSDPTQHSYYKNYGFKITEDGVLKRNFIPAKRNSDNVVGMWDTVTQTFFTNAGSGSFIAGPVVQ